ncbi:hypothetical protein EXIGLDRAFT_568748, partial [Exidia glandulosa HHB12029]
TGDGKTCMFYYIIIVMLYFARRGWKPPNGKIWPKHPVGLILCTVIGIEEQMVEMFLRLGLPSVAINADALRDNPGLWSLAALESTCLIGLAPEYLRTPSFQALLSTRGFLARLVLLGADEIHLLLTWGLSFRQAFRQIGFLNARLHVLTRIVALTASILPGREVQAVCESLGLRATDMVFQRRSNLRGNITLERRIVSLTGPTFPDFDWFVTSTGLKSILFCGTISMAFRIATDLW